MQRESTIWSIIKSYMRNQPIPDSVQIIVDPKLPALSVMTFERDDGMYEHHMTIQKE
jgi:hypothetical protein